MLFRSINTINTRLDPHTIAYILEHSDAKFFIVDTQFSPVIKKALDLVKKEIPIFLPIFTDFSDFIGRLCLVVVVEFAMIHGLVMTTFYLTTRTYFSRIDFLPLRSKGRKWISRIPHENLEEVP